MPKIMDTAMIVRCPYCLAGLDFRPMVAYDDGRFICHSCAHAVRPGVLDYKCGCNTCFRVMEENKSIDSRNAVLIH